MILGNIAILKILRRVPPGIHPKTEMTRFLTEPAIANIATLFGEVVRVDADGKPPPLLIAEWFVRNQGDGWGWTLDWLRRASMRGAQPGPTHEASREPIAGYQRFAAADRQPPRRAARGAGNAHDDPAFAPEPAEAGEAMAWATATAEQVDRALQTLEIAPPGDDDSEHETATGTDRAPPPAQRRKIRELAEAGAGTLEDARARRLPSRPDAGRRRRRRVPDRLRGRAGRAAAERRRKGIRCATWPGCLRSFDYAAATFARERAPRVADRGRAVTSARALRRRGFGHVSSTPIDRRAGGGRAHGCPTSRSRKR